MNDLEQLGLKLRDTTEANSNEKRTEIRIASTQDFVAWFCWTKRLSDGEEVTSTATQFVRRKELTHEQILAIEAWFREQVSAFT
jgi:hypothetical protein